MKNGLNIIMKKQKLWLSLFLIISLAGSFALGAGAKQKVAKDSKNYLAYAMPDRENSTVASATSQNNVKNVYNIDGRELYSYSKRLALTKYQQAQVDYLEIERKSKILALDKEISYRRKLLDEELANDMYDAFTVDEISKEIKELVIDKETVNLNVDKKLRYVLDSDQYLKYKQKQKNKNKETIQ